MELVSAVGNALNAEKKDTLPEIVQTQGKKAVSIHFQDLIQDLSRINPRQEVAIKGEEKGHHQG